MCMRMSASMSSLLAMRELLDSPSASRVVMKAASVGAKTVHALPRDRRSTKCACKGVCGRRAGGHGGARRSGGASSQRDAMSMSRRERNRPERDAAPRGGMC
jgi:hypothetical protein